MDIKDRSFTNTLQFTLQFVMLVKLCIYTRGNQITSSRRQNENIRYITCLVKRIPYRAQEYHSAEELKVGKLSIRGEWVGTGKGKNGA